jgi:hypothetical protein
MNTLPCVYCGAERGLERDHLGGSDEAGTYLRPSLWVPAGRRCNVAAWRAWRACGLHVIGGRDALVVELRRSAVSLARIGARRGLESVELPAATLGALAALYVAAADRIEERGR